MRIAIAWLRPARALRLALRQQPAPAPARGMAAAAAAASAAAPAAVPTLRDLLPPRPRRVIKKGTRKVAAAAAVSRPEDCPYVATHTVQRAMTVAPPGRKLADVRVLGKLLRPDLAAGVSAHTAPAASAGAWESTTSSGGSSGPSSSSSSSSSGSDTASDGEGGVAASSALSPSAPGGLRAPADAGDAGVGALLQGAASSSAAAAAGAMRLFAVIPLGGTQYKVTPGDVINAERIRHAVVGEPLVVPTVHVVGSARWTVLGRPCVPGATVTLRVEEHALDRKVIVYKKNRRKRYQRTAGHRRMVTRLRVEAVDAPAPGGGAWALE